MDITQIGRRGGEGLAGYHHLQIICFNACFRYRNKIITFFCRLLNCLSNKFKENKNYILFFISSFFFPVRGFFFLITSSGFFRYDAVFRCVIFLFFFLHVNECANYAHNKGHVRFHWTQCCVIQKGDAHYTLRHHKCNSL